MKIHEYKNIQYWYDASTKCWWCMGVDFAGNQNSEAVHAYSKHEIVEIVKSIAKE